MLLPHMCNSCNVYRSTTVSIAAGTVSKTDVTGAKTDITDSKTDITDSKTDVTGAKTDITDSKTDVTGAKTGETDSKAAGTSDDVLSENSADDDADKRNSSTSFAFCNEALLTAKIVLGKQYCL